MQPQPQNPKTLLKTLADQDLLGHGIPARWGGLGSGFQDWVEAHWQWGHDCHDPGAILAINAHLWGALFPILRHGNEGQKQRWLPGLVSGNLLGGHAITEAEAGSDPAAMTSRAAAVKGGYRLNGSKRYITNAPDAEVLIVYARLEGKISAWVVQADDPGLEITTEHPVAAYHGAPMGEIHLHDCQIPGDRLLGKPGAGPMLIQNALEWERAFLFAGIGGAMAWQLEQVIDFSRRRRSGDGHLGRHQAIAHRIADMATRLDTVRLWLQECARLADGGKRLTLASAQTKLVASEAFLQSSLDAVQILGAQGLEQSSPMARWLNHAAAGRLLSGSSEIQKNLIAALLGTGEGYRLKSQPSSL